MVSARRILLPLLAALLATPVILADDARTISVQFVGGGSVLATCTEPLAPTPPIVHGGTCFVLLPGESTVRLDITKDTATGPAPVSGYYAFDDRTGVTFGVSRLPEQGQFCGTIDLPVPSAAKRIDVIARGFVDTQCEPGARDSLIVERLITGTITATIR